MSVSNIEGLSQTNIAFQQEQKEPTLQESDGLLVVDNGKSQHPLQNEHCKPCLTVYQELQVKAQEGGPEAQDLLKRAQSQMEALQNQQIKTLQSKSDTPIAYATPKGEAALSVSVSNAAQLRARNLSRIASESIAVKPTAQPSESTAATTPAIPDTAGAPKVDTSSTGESHSEGDGHGHGKDDKKDSGLKGTASAKTEDKNSAHGHGGSHEDSLSADELKEVQELSQRDMEVRTHEQAHKSAAGSHGGSISLTYRKGPDGKRYAVEGEVPVDLSSVKGDPEATVAKMEQIHRAALAPAQPSSADRRVAARAAQKAAKARQEIIKEGTGENPLKKEHSTTEAIQVRGGTKNADASTAKTKDSSSKVSQGKTSTSAPETINKHASSLSPSKQISDGVITDSGKDRAVDVPDVEPPTSLTAKHTSKAATYDQYAKPTTASVNSTATDSDGMVNLSLNVYA